MQIISGNFLGFIGYKIHLYCSFMFINTPEIKYGQYIWVCMDMVQSELQTSLIYPDTSDFFLVFMLANIPKFYEIHACQYSLLFCNIFPDIFCKSLSRTSVIFSPK